MITIHGRHFNYFVIIYYLSGVVPSPGFIKSGWAVLGRYCGPSSRVCFSKVSSVCDRGRYSAAPFFLVSHFPFDKMLLPAAARFRRLLLLMLLINRLACPFVFVVGAESALALTLELQLSSPRKFGHELFLCGARSSSTVGRRFVLDIVVNGFDGFILRIYCARSTGKQAMLAPMVALALVCAAAVGLRFENGFEWTTATFVFLVASWWRRRVDENAGALVSTELCVPSGDGRTGESHFISF